jgi:thiosulfate/3-mercaptopyruvate sulfurtransferase
MSPTVTADLSPSLLVDAEWLSRHLADCAIRILDVRGRHPSSPLPHAKRTEYLLSHIPGAVFVDWTADFIDRSNPVPYQLAAPEQVAADAVRLGIDTDDTVVTYDDYYGLHACRVAWALRCHGVDARVLDGGWRSWVDEGRSVNDATTPVRRASFPVRDANGLRVTLDDLEHALDRGATVVDARPRHLYLGDPTAPGTGHIPGAHALSYQELVDGATGLFQSPDAIRRLVADAGLDPADPPAEIITTCGIGVSATVALIALERAGISVTGVYDGAWSEWSADADRPVAYGALSAGPGTAG